jgi:type I restriction enzyme, S subunit
MAEQIKSLKTGIKYKDTPIGRIPVDWEVVRLNDICDVIGGSTPSTVRKDFWNGDIPFATPTDITNLHGREISNTKQKITQEGLSSCGTRLLPAGSVLLTSRATIGACAINTKPMTTNQGFASLVCNEKAYNWYIFYEMMLRKYELQRLGSGSTFKEVSKNSLRQLNITLPPLAEQKKVAEILSTVDETIEKTDQIIEKTKEAKNWLLEILFSYGINNSKYKDHAEIGRMPEKWNVETLGNLISIKHGYAFKSQHYGSEGPILLTPGNFKKDGGLHFNERNLKRYYGGYPEEFTLLKNDLVIVMTDLSSYCKILGNPALISLSEMVLHNQRIGKVVFNDNKIDKKYLYYFFLSKRYKKTIISTATGTTVRHTAPDRIYRLKIALPPHEEQQEIVEILSSIDAELDKEVAGKNKLEILKNGLMQVLLTGRIRVKA